MIQNVAALTTSPSAAQPRGHVKPRPIHPVNERGELRCSQPHHAVADRRPPEGTMLQPFPEQHQAGPVPGHDLQSIRPLRPKDENRPRERIVPSCSRTSAASPSAPRRKSTGLVATSTRTPAGTAIMSPPSRRAAPPQASRHRSQAEPEPWQRRSRSRSPPTRLDRQAQAARPRTAEPPPRSPAQMPSRSHRLGRRPPPRHSPPPRVPAPPEQLLRSQPVPPRNRRHLLAALIALGEDPRLLLRGPGAAPTGPGKHFQPAHRLRLRLVQKLSVRHVSNPLDSAGRHSPISHRP